MNDVADLIEQVEPFVAGIEIGQFVAHQFVRHEPGTPRGIEPEPQDQAYEIDRRETKKVEGKETEILSQGSVPLPEQRNGAEEYVQGRAGEANLKSAPVVTEGIEASVPWQRESQQAKSFWTTECEEAVKETRQKYYEMLRYHTPETERLHSEARRRKVAIIRKVK